MRNGFRDYIEDQSDIPSSILQLTSIVATFPVTSADCERGFSTMNNICTKTRNSLHVDNIADLLFISLVGPPMAEFNPKPYVTEWLKRNHRDALDNRARKVEGAYSKRYETLWPLFK